MRKQMTTRKESKHLFTGSGEDPLSLVAQIQEMTFKDTTIRSVLLEGAPWFVVKDLCAALDLADTTTSVRGLDADEKRKVHVQTASGIQEMHVVNESGLYLLTFNSRKTGAVAFRKWVTAEVLPSLRKAANGEAQGKGPGSAYCRIPGPGHFRVTLEGSGRLTLYELEFDRYVPDFYSPEVDALALATCLVGAIWRKFQMLEAMSALNAECSNSRYQLGEAIKQAQQIAKSTMRNKLELVDGCSPDSSREGSGHGTARSY